MYDVENGAKSAICDGVCQTLDVGSGAPTAEVQTSAGAVLMVIGLNTTRAVAAAVNGVGTFNAPTTGGGSWSAFSQLPSGAGVAARVSVKDGNGLERFKQTVGTIAGGTGEWVFTSLTFNVEVPVTATTAPIITAG